MNYSNNIVRQEKPASYLSALMGSASTQKASSSHSSTASSSTQQATSSFNGRYISIIDNVHEDDIHALISLGKGTFATGSKDTTIKLWNDKWEQTHILYPPSEYESSQYCHWITALTLLDDGNIASGTRDGAIAIWKPNGELISWCQQEYKGGVHSKVRNSYRINCLHSLSFSENARFFLTGLPGIFSTWKWNTFDKILPVKQTRIQGNDWTYCIKSLNQEDILIASGSVLEVWTKTIDHKGFLSWKYKTRVLSEKPDEVTYPRGHKQRPLISSMEFLSTHEIAMASFSGHIKTFDLESNKISMSWKEHFGRAWTISKISDQTFLSGADDHKAKLWDVRQSQSAMTFSDHSGRVSCVLNLDNHQFVAASCPDNVKDSQEKASLTFWDLRKA